MFENNRVEAESVADFLEKYYKKARYHGRGAEYAAGLLASHEKDFGLYGYDIISHHDSVTGEVVAYFGNRPTKPPAEAIPDCSPCPLTGYNEIPNCEPRCDDCPAAESAPATPACTDCIGCLYDTEADAPCRFAAVLTAKERLLTELCQLIDDIEGDPDIVTIYLLPRPTLRQAHTRRGPRLHCHRT